MNILVVNPGNKPFTNKSILAEPIDVLMIASIIKEKYNTVKVIDMDVDRKINDLNCYLEDENIVVFVYDYQLPLHTSETVENIFEIIRNCKKKTKFIIIGKTSSYRYQEFLDRGIDVVVRGIVDKTINLVIDAINDDEKLKNISNIVFKCRDKVILTRSEKIECLFDDVIIPDRSLVNINKYMDTRTMITSRGCIGTCKFCATPYFFGRWDCKSVDKVVDEIEMLIRKYGAKKIMFLDDNATVDKKRMMDICKEIKKRNIKCLFGALSSIGCYDRKLFLEMYNVGFRWVHFGLESGSFRLLEKMNKKMNQDKVKEIIKEVKEMGYRVRTSFILDYPGSTSEDILMTRDLILELEPHEIRLHYLAYRVGTPIFIESKNISNNTQYIHSNKPNIYNKKLMKDIELLVNSLKDNGYLVVNDEIDWNIYNERSKDTKIVAFTPIKYGMCWYE